MAAMGIDRKGRRGREGDSEESGSKEDSSSGSGESGKGGGAGRDWQGSDDEEGRKDSGVRGVDIDRNNDIGRARFSMVLKARERVKVGNIFRTTLPAGLMDHF